MPVHHGPVSMRPGFRISGRWKLVRRSAHCGEEDVVIWGLFAECSSIVFWVQQSRGDTDVLSQRQSYVSAVLSTPGTHPSKSQMALALCSG